MGVGKRKEEPNVHPVDHRMTWTKNEHRSASAFLRSLQRRAKLRLKVIPNDEGGEDDEGVGRSG